MYTHYSIDQKPNSYPISTIPPHFDAIVFSDPVASGYWAMIQNDKGKENGKWWFQVQDQVLGYWPGTIFNYLVSSASRIEWGGEVYNAELGDHHTRTQMGSGHFGNEGYGKACYFRNIGYLDNSGKFIDVEAQSLKKYATRPSCYNVEVANNTNGGFGTHFYFGGPGYSTQCAN
ncbi:hypothetical protein CFP56_008472 [Quercus suber]|uniref:Neprosin PEP catalytic domain-containing protein n=1 Tax=Quercus suber TaxID=58331 RepID=A0AAW0L3N7_QUESU